MKYLIIAIMWCILITCLIIERLIKVLIVAIQIIWHFKINNKWFDIFLEYHLVIPIPLKDILMAWRIENLHDYFSLKNWHPIK